MYAIRVAATGGPEVLVLAEVDPPVPGPGEVLLQVAAAGVNFIEIYQRLGRYPLPLPFTPGSEAAGTVAGTGPGVDTVRVGDRVGSVAVAGSYAQLAVVPAAAVVPVPDGVDTTVAAAALLQGMTAHYLLHDSYPVRPGDTVLVHAAAGGVGLLLTQLATALGARVLATTSTPAKAELARAAGAAEVLGYDGFAARVRELTGGAGVAAVYDGVGQATFEQSLASVRRRGVLVLYGAASGPVPPFDLARLAPAGSLSVTRPTLADFVADPAELAGRAGDVLGRVTDGTLDVRIHHEYPLAEAARAHEDLAGRGTTGKLLLLP